MAENRTEKATPKKRQEAREKGQVARSVDATGAIVMLAAVMGLSAFGPMMYRRMAEATVTILDLIRGPSGVDRRGTGELCPPVGGHAFAGAAPLVVVCAIAGILANVLQVGF